MPLIKIFGIAIDNPVVQQIALALQQTISEISELEISKNEIVVACCFGNIYVKSELFMKIVFVEVCGLFITPERTDEVLKRMLNAIVQRVYKTLADDDCQNFEVKAYISSQINSELLASYPPPK